MKNSESHTANGGVTNESEVELVCACALIGFGLVGLMIIVGEVLWWSLNTL